MHSFSGGSGAMAGDTLPILRREHRRRSNHGECITSVTCRAAWHASHQLGEPPEMLSLEAFATLSFSQCMDGLSDLAYASIYLADQTQKKPEIPQECFATVVHGFPFPPSSKRHERNPPSVLCWPWTGVSSNRSQGDGFHWVAFHFIFYRPRAKHSPLQNTSFGRRDGETNLGFH